MSISTQILESLALAHSGRIDEAEALLVETLRRSPENFDALQLLATLVAKRRQFATAAELFQKALAINPRHAVCLNNQGNALLELGRTREALASFDAALAVNSDYSQAWSNRGTALRALGSAEKALESCDRGLELAPDLLQAWCNRGAVLIDLNRPEEALSSLDRALTMEPGYFDALVNRGSALRLLDRQEEALHSFDEALALRPGSVDVMVNRGNALRDLDQLEEALTCYQKALTIKPDHAMTRYNRSLTYLLTGNFGIGWQEYEWRWIDPALARFRRNFVQPLWLGAEPLAGKSILLHCEQGLGDTLQFCRYVRKVADLGAEVIFEVPRPLFGLLKSLAGASTLLARGDPLPLTDYHCPLLSLPLAFKTSLHNIPASVPYLFADEGKIALWKQRLGRDGLKIGIHWQGGKTRVDVGRSFSIEHFHAISRISGVRLISLQKNEGAEQMHRRPAGMVVEDLGANFDSGPDAFLDSAGIIRNLDLVITSDTAIAHLSAALGCSTWVALKRVPDWRWMLRREDCCWYPGMRLFRQEKSGDWEQVFDDIRGAVQRQIGNVIQ